MGMQWDVGSFRGSVGVLWGPLWVSPHEDSESPLGTWGATGSQSP